MYLKVLAAALAASALAGGAAAQMSSTMAAPAATPGFNLFKEFCAAHPGDFDGVVAALKARGFDGSRDVITGGTTDQVASYQTSIDGADYLVALSLMPPTDDVEWTRPLLMCAVMRTGPEPASLDAARDWAGVELSGKPTGQELYLWRETPGGRVRLTDMDGPDAVEALKAGQYRQLNLVTDGRGVGLVLLTQ